MSINNAIQLEHQIAVLKKETANKKAVLVQQFYNTYESLKPVNLIKAAFNSKISLPKLGDNFIGTSMGLGAGILSKKILAGRSPGFFKSILSTVAEVAVAGLVAKNSDTIKHKGLQLIRSLISKTRKKNTIQ
jgi:hypothetical protein